MTESKPFSAVAFIMALICGAVAGLILDFGALGAVIAAGTKYSQGIKFSSFLFGGLFFVGVGLAIVKRHRELGAGFICGGVVALLVGGSCATMTL